MNETLVFDYYYGKEAEQFSFYRIPRMLIKDKHFSSLSNDAKILYGLMLDRMSLSLKNEWQDDQDRTYIIYTIDNIMEDLNCGKNKAVRIMAELDSSDGIGLIERVRRGLGKPDIIYVKNFVGVQIIEKPNYEDEDAAKEEEKIPSNPHKSTEVSKANFKKFQKQTSASFGDIVLFGTDHIELVVSVNPDGSVTTIGGNTSSDEAGSQSNGGCVALKTRYTSGSFPITSFIHPEY